MKDPYEVLGVSRSATQIEIREAYHALCLKFHPDKHGDNPLGELAAEKLQEVNEAYETLSDVRARREYDRTGATAGGPAGSRSVPHGVEQQFNRVVEMAQNRQFSSALRELDQMESAHGVHAEWLDLRGAILIQMDRHQEAVAVYQRAIEMNPTEYERLASLGAALTGGEQYHEAAETLARARSHLGDRPELMAMEALAREEIGQKQQAKALFERVRAEDPQNEIHQARDQVWRVGGGYMNKDKAKSDACCLCILLECMFDCI